MASECENYKLTSCDRTQVVVSRTNPSQNFKNERLAVWQRVAVGFRFFDQNVFDFV